MNITEEKNLKKRYVFKVSELINGDADFSFRYKGRKYFISKDQSINSLKIEKRSGAYYALLIAGLLTPIGVLLTIYCDLIFVLLTVFYFIVILAIKPTIITKTSIFKNKSIVKNSVFFAKFFHRLENIVKNYREEVDEVKIFLDL